MKEIVKIFKALSDKNRLRIVNMLLVKPLCVCELTTVLQLATSTVSKHLSILREADIITDDKNGKWVDYKINFSNSLYTNDIIEYLKEHLNSEQFKKDIKAIGKVDRYIICNINIPVLNDKNFQKT